MRTEKFTIDYPRTKDGRTQWNKDYGLNAIYAGKHWSKRKQDSEYWHNMVYAALGRAKILKKQFDTPVIVTMYWHDNLDVDNHGYMGKMIVDAMKGWLLKDDSKRYLAGVEHYIHSQDCIIVQIREVDTTC